MGASRRKRKRYRRQALKGPLRGDRPKSPVTGSGGVSGLWADATRGELRLLRHAIREDWPVPDERRPTIIDEVSQILQSGDIRRALAVVWVFLEADRQNLPPEQ